MFSPSYIELSQTAFAHNISFIRNLVGPKVRISSVVKGNAYGHGIEKMVPLIEEAGVDHIAVYNADEAYRVFKTKQPDTDIMIMGMIDNHELEWALQNDVELYVFEPDRLRNLFDLARQMDKKAKIHLHLETGMNRLGLTRRELEDIVSLLKKNRELYQLVGVCTHFAGAEHIANHVRVTQQLENYWERLEFLKRHDLNPEYRHVASSAATISYPQTRLDMVRIGILQYGFWPSTETKMGYLTGDSDKTDPLRRVICWKSRVMSVQNVEAGEFVGYGTTFLARDDMKIAGVPVGYADGYARSLSNFGRLLINGHRVDVVGTVNMNMMSADVTQAPETKKGDEVVIIGDQGELSISVAPFGEVSDQMNYERLTKLSTRIPRKVVP